ncbi:MAG: c-type cytochrome [Verrucomicrobia bacterium]|nr:c-type cytochrome [Verrucomicrobiota bacterium]
MLLFLRVVIWSAVSSLLAAGALAQIGDKLDKPGEVQKSIVPVELIPPAPVLAPAEALKSFRLAPGIRLELVAAEPLVQDPVAITFGPDGRCWVAEFRGYMNDFEGSNEDARIGRIVVLTDTNGDGVYDKSDVFLDKLILPRALLLVGDGLLVGAPPYLKFWRDTDGDGKADLDVDVASDFGVQTDPKRPELANPERAPNALLWGADNWIYSAAYTKKFRYVRGNWETSNTMFRGQWGLSQDDFGRLYYNSNSDQLRADVLPSQYPGRNPNYPRAGGVNVLVPENQLVWPARVTPGTNRAYRPETMRDGKLKAFTAACAPWIFRSNALGAEYYGNAFVCEPAAHLIKRNLVTADHGTVKAREAYEQREFIASVDERFRPVNLATGPDGALYIVDFHRGVIEHRISLTSYLRKQAEERDLIKPQHLGRIYRVVAEGAKPEKFPRLDRMPTQQLVAELSHSNSWRRETAQRLLVERADPNTHALMRELAILGVVPFGRLHALRALGGLGWLDEEMLTIVLRDKMPEVRVTAIRLCEPFVAGPMRASLVPRLMTLSGDPSPEVQQQLVLTLTQVGDPGLDATLAGIVRRWAETKFLTDALFSGIYDRELPLLEKLLANPEWKAVDPGAVAILRGLAKGIVNSRRPELVERLLAVAMSVEPARQTLLFDGAVSATAATAAKPVKFPAEPKLLAGFKGSIDPTVKAGALKLERLLTWPGKPGAKPEVVPPPLTPPEQAMFNLGRALYPGVCGACHQPHGRGLEGMAPPLAESEWSNGPASRAARIALHGVRGPIKVDGRTYTLDMPPFGALGDEQLAALLTYIRREWGNTGTAVSPAEVKAIRAGVGKRTDAWTQEELLKVP